MSQFTETDLGRLMRDVLGPTADLDTDRLALDADFRELDFDSLAVLELVSRVQQRTGLEIPDEAIEEMVTPRRLLSYVDSQLSGV